MHLRHIVGMRGLYEALSTIYVFLLEYDCRLVGRKDRGLKA